ncbi:MAG: peptidoglycan-binding protein [Actinomycetota bacterium]
MRRLPRLAPALGVAALVVVAVISGLTLGFGDDAESSEPTAATTPNTAQVVRADLVDEITFDGTVGLPEPEILDAGLGGTLTAIAPVDTTLADGDIAYRTDGTNVPVIIDDGVLYRDLQLGDRPVQVTAPSSAAAMTVTSVAAPGSSVAQGDVIFHLNDEPVVALYGNVTLSRTLAVPETTSTSSYASAVRAGQDRVALVEGIDNARQALDDYRASLPSSTLLNAIEDLTELERTGAGETALRDANQRIQAAQDADEAGLEAAEDAVVRAEQALIDFDEVQAAADRDEAVADASRVPDNQTGADVLALETALAALGYDDGGNMTVDFEYTAATERAVEAWQTDVGAEVTGVVEPTSAVFIDGPATVIDGLDDRSTVNAGQPILTLGGGEELVGDDVALLERTLARSGLDGLADLEVDDRYTEETYRAVLTWQEATGQEVDGIVSAGDVVILTEPGVVWEHHLDLGEEVRVGSPVLSLTQTERFVTIEVPAEDQSVLAVGDAVTIELPDFTETSGRVTEVSATAIERPDGTTIFEATAALDDPTAAAGLNEAPVDVTAIESQIVDVLAVPVTALLALAEGGYAVELVSDTGTQLVAVDAGFYADGLVEIDTASGLGAGDVVTVP